MREYKKYMQAPTVLRDSLVELRKRKLKKLLERDTQNKGLELEKDFLSTLPFYRAIKESTLCPLLTMQVSLVILGKSAPYWNGQSLI